MGDSPRRVCHYNRMTKRNGPGRPKVSAKLRKSEEIRVVVSPTLRRKCVKSAKAFDMSLADWVRHVLLAEAE